MEYEKQINRLVLGYLKNECKSAYKVFFKSHFQNYHKHIATRVAGQTLEDILRIYSRVQDIVQGRLEETDFYRDNGAGFSSPIYLPEQLLYLLDKGRPYTPMSSSCNRSPAASSIPETYNENDDLIDHTSDVETTPEHSLPGNMHSDDNNDLKTPLRRKSPVFRTPYLEKLPSSEHENISSVMTMKLLEKREFHEKLAHNITTALNTPELSSSLRKGDSEGDRKGLGAELEDTIKNALNRTEADPMFEDLLQDFLDPIGKAIAGETAATSSSSTTPPSHNFSNVEDQNRGAISSMLALSNANTPYKSVNSDAGSSSENGRNDQTVSKVISTEQLGTCQVGTTDYGNVPQIVPSNVENQQVFYTSCVPSTSIIQTSGQQQQQFYIVNQPLVIPQTVSFFQPRSIASKPAKKKSLPKPIGPLTEQDIMSMPTIILNDRNEVTYADPGSLIATTPYKLNEVHNIKEYLNAFGATDQSPIIKNTPKKPQPLIKPTPTIKVEVFQRNSPLRTVEDDQVDPSNPSKELPNLNDNTLEEVHSTTCSDKEIATASAKEVPNSISNPLCTPSPVVTTARKPTPKSSGSHVRNLTFPSPVRKSNEKPDANRNSPSILNKQQATKDLFNNKSEEEAEKTQKKHSSPKKKSPKKATSPSKSKKVTKPLNKNKQTKTPESWDATLRKNLASTSDENRSTPKRSSSKRRRKRSHESDVCADGKKLEEALKTPAKSEKSKRKTPTTKKNAAKTSKPASEEEEEEATSVDTKKVLSPSKLCNTASKRNMEVDGVTPSNTKAAAAAALNARRNINSLLETPLKQEATPSTSENVPNPTNSPFTPMLKANLKGLTVGDTFSIDTPDFPVTPGLSLMEHSSAAYCILNDTETNKATEAIVLSEEKKSSVRKTDDEDVVVSPKVYGCQVTLADFNKSRTGKKNLELLDSQGVSWDGSSDREDKSDSSSSGSDEETNSTVIQKSAVPRKPRSSGKSMATLKSRLLEKTEECDHGNMPSNSDADEEDKTTQANVDKHPKLSKLTNNRNESRSVPVSRLSKNSVEDKAKASEDDKNKRSNNKSRNSKVEAAKQGTSKVPPRSAESLTSITPDVIKQAVASVPENCSGHITPAYSLKAEMDEKRRRVIELEKASQAPKSRGRPKSHQPDQVSSRNKRKRCAPRKSLVNVDYKEEDSNDLEEVDSQDEFFKKSGTNLHRTNNNNNNNKQQIAESHHNEAETCAKAESDGLLERKANEPPIQSQIIVTDNKSTEGMKKKEDSTANVTADSSWERSALELQPEAKVVVYDEQRPCNKSLKDYDFNLLNKQLHMNIPLEGGSIQPIIIQATPHKILFEIEPSVNGGNCSSDSENVESKGAKKRKHRTDSCNSDTSAKKMKTSLPRNCLNENNIAKLLTKLHGPTDKT